MSLPSHGLTRVSPKRVVSRRKYSEYCDRRSSDPQYSLVCVEAYSKVKSLPIILLIVYTVFNISLSLSDPIEYAKVMGQTKQKWILRDVYRGTHWQVLRTTTLLIPIFGSLDWFRRHTNVMNSFVGNFCVTAGAAAGAYLLCWPLETLKNLSQSGTPRPGASISECLAYLGGPLGIYRGKRTYNARVIEKCSKLYTSLRCRAGCSLWGTSKWLRYGNICYHYYTTHCLLLAYEVLTLWWNLCCSSRYRWCTHSPGRLS